MDFVPSAQRTLGNDRKILPWHSVLIKACFQAKIAHEPEGSMNIEVEGKKEKENLPVDKLAQPNYIVVKRPR